MLDITQAEVAAAVGVSRSHYAGIEAAKEAPSIDLVWRIADRLGLELELVGRPPVVSERRCGDLVHARCSGYIDRRFRRAGWLTMREVETSAGRAHGWIDLLAFEPSSRTLVIVEVKTRLDDIGAVERQLGWYERDARRLAAEHGWYARAVTSWLLLLASDEVERQIGIHRDLLQIAFPDRARAMRVTLTGPRNPARRGLALIDPTSRRSRWLIPSRADGRRTESPYRDYADAASRFARRRPGRHDLDG
jgi:transcriptional regulator with XRE-family HTH domain